LAWLENKDAYATGNKSKGRIEMGGQNLCSGCTWVNRDLLYYVSIYMEEAGGVEKKGITFFVFMYLSINLLVERNKGFCS
jgi:hypothetical protein